MPESKKQLECRLVIIHKKSGQIELGMYDPGINRYEFLGVHGPEQKAIDKAIYGLKASILDAGHKLTFCERSEFN